jgi:hypothetical protein
MRRDIVGRGENGFHLWQMRLNGIAESEPVGGLKENLRDENVASPMLVDPLHRIVGVCGRPGPGPAKVAERLRQSGCHSGPAIHDQYFH